MGQLAYTRPGGPRWAAGPGGPLVRRRGTQELELSPPVASGVGLIGVAPRCLTPTQRIVIAALLRVIAELLVCGVYHRKNARRGGAFAGRRLRGAQAIFLVGVASR